MSEIAYNLPEVTAEEAAGKAIAALKDIEQLGGDSLFYCIQASNVLALAGLRALSPYNEFHPDYSDEKLEKLNNTLTKHDCRILQQDEYGSEADRRDFSIMNIAALQSTYIRYPMTKDAPLQPPKEPTWTTYTQWSVRMWIHYANLIDEGTLPEKWRQDWFIPHHIQFGMMLGYPGVALHDTCERGTGELDRDVDMDLVDIEIDTSDTYDSVDVSYAVSKRHLDHPEILAHSSLWKDTLEKVYGHFTDEKLQAIAGFSEEDAKFPLEGEKSD